jgi:hypothetical protein
MKTLVAVGSALLAALALAWTAGLEHQANCVHAGRVSCSVLPWDDGQPSQSQKLVDGLTDDGFGP